MIDKHKVLVVDDEPGILSFLTENLQTDDWDVHSATSGAQAMSRLHAHTPDIVLLDVMLPDTTGYEVCRKIRSSDASDVRFDPNVPIVMLTARGEDVDRVRGFERGADDYLVKPFFYPELLARMQALMRRIKASPTEDVMRAAGLEIDLSTCSVRVNGSEVKCSQKELELLVALASDPRRVFRKHELLKKVWGYKTVGSTRTLDSHASRLRKKLQPFSSGRSYIANVWGVGYRLVGSETQPASTAQGVRLGRAEL